MRKPPDKAQAARPVTESDINNSNATLNSFFGNSRTKSWMTNSGSHNPVRPTPRASQSSVPQFREQAYVPFAMLDVAVACCALLEQG